MGQPGRGVGHRVRGLRFHAVGADERFLDRPDIVGNDGRGHAVCGLAQHDRRAGRADRRPSPRRRRRLRGGVCDDGAAMYSYLAASAAAAVVTPFVAPAQTANPDGVNNQADAVAKAAATPAGQAATVAQDAAAAVPTTSAQTTTATSTTASTATT